MASILNADTSNGLKITSDTSGELKIQSAGADIATVDSSGITMASGKGLAGDASSLTNIPAANLTGSLPAGMGGKILQVVTATKTDSVSTSSTSFVDITGLSISITPSSASSKILVTFSIGFHGTYVDTGYIRFMRNSTVMVQPTSAGSRALVHAATNNYNQESNLVPICFTFLDSPATTSATVYKPQMASANGNTVYLNRTAYDTDAFYYPRVSSTIVAMEVSD